MKSKLFLVVTIFACAFYSCKKVYVTAPQPTGTPPGVTHNPPMTNDTPAYSVWMVNDDTFSMNKATVAAFGIQSENYAMMPYGFVIDFNFPHTQPNQPPELPTSGSYPLARLNDTPAYLFMNYVFMGIRYDSINYAPSDYSNSHIDCSLENHKSKLTLDSTWFVNINDTQDSVMVRGVFRQPLQF